MPVDRAICFWCAWMGRAVRERVVQPVDAVFEALCGHDECPSMVFHGLCLMEFRDDERFAAARRLNDEMILTMRSQSGYYGGN